MSYSITLLIREKNLKRKIPLEPGTKVQVRFQGHFMHGKTTTIVRASSELRGLYWLKVGASMQTVLHEQNFKAVEKSIFSSVLRRVLQKN